MLIGSVACYNKEDVNNNHDTPQDSGRLMMSPSLQQTPTQTIMITNTTAAPSFGLMNKRRTNKSYIALMMMVLALIISSHNTMALGTPTKWLQRRLKRIAAAHLAVIEATTTTKSPPIETPPIDVTTTKSTPLRPETDDSPPPLLVVSTHEGQVWTIDSTDGRVIAGFSTGPPLLIMDDHYEAASSSDDKNNENTSIGLSSNPNIVPSMDGMIYWRTNSPDGPKLTPVRPIRDLVDNPIQICPNGEGESCDILTATSLGPSLFSLNSQGSLNWARSRQAGGETTRVKPVPMQRTSSSSSTSSSTTVVEDDDDDDSSSSSSTTNADSSGSRSSLLLQRQDYLVQQISTATGEQISNITWGNLERIDFNDDDGGGGGGRRRNDQSFHFLPSDKSGSTTSSDLPSVIFGNHGKSIVAVMTQPPKFLWKRDFISLVTGVFGIENDTWQPVNVVADNDGPEVDDDDDPGGVGNGGGDGGGRRPAAAYHPVYPELPSSSNSEPSTEEEEAERWYWFWAGGGKGLGKKNQGMEQYLVHGQGEETGLIFVPRTPANHLVRNSWYLNHLWNSPQAMGAQSFHGYLSDRSHKEEEEEAAAKSQRGGYKSPPSRVKKQLHPYHYPANFYDTSTMPRLMLLPPAEHPPIETTKTGGVFLSWSVVMAIVTLLCLTVGAAYVVYGQKKRKWLATSNSGSVGSQDVPADVTSDTLSSSLINNDQGRSVSGRGQRPHHDADVSKSRSKEQSQQSRSQKDGLRNSDSNLGIRISPLSAGKPLKHVLNRSSSAPIMAGDHVPSFDENLHKGLIVKSLHMGQDPSIRQRDLSNKPETASSIDERQAKVPVVQPSHLVKHQSAPIDSPHLPQGGVGMIDGIPLIRYSRYQSEFRELEPLGRGGFGTVFRVANVLDGREYAVKKVSIRSGDLSSPGTEAFSQELHRVLREVKFLALLDHPNIVRYYTAWLEMEEKEQSQDADENTNTLSRRFSSELLTSLDPTNGLNGDNTTTTQSFLGRKPSSSTSRATVSHLKGRNATNPLGWNNFGNFEESSASAFYPRHSLPVLPPTDEDCGFIFEERSDEEEEEGDTSFGGDQRHSHGRSVASSEGSRSDFSHSVSSSWDASFSTNRRQKNAPGVTNDENPDEEKKGSPDTNERRTSKTSRHTLYIQMQLCSSKTLGDFLGDKEARQGPTSSANSASVDIPKALRLFLQIVQAVQHVHKQNLIHRDLKPSNCFIDEKGTVKVGDFGLSRESSDGNDNSASTSLVLDRHDDGAGDNTVGVGTRSYASPEQMNGSDYDSKTDIYALGVMLFELLYPMYTGMERHICFQNLRATTTSFPDGWNTTVSGPFPALNELVRSMLTLNPKQRPTADKVARHIQSLVEEHSVSLNFSNHEGENDNITFVRVEAKPLPDILKIIIELIHKVSSPKAVDVVQYGMRSSTKSSNVSGGGLRGEKRAVLEFALACADVESKDLSAWASRLACTLEESDEVLVARHVWHQAAEQSF